MYMKNDHMNPTRIKNIYDVWMRKNGSMKDWPLEVWFGKYLILSIADSSVISFVFVLWSNMCILTNSQLFLSVVLNQLDSAYGLLNFVLLTVVMLPCKGVYNVKEEFHRNARNITQHKHNGRQTTLQVDMLQGTMSY